MEIERACEKNRISPKESLPVKATVKELVDAVASGIEEMYRDSDKRPRSKCTTVETNVHLPKSIVANQLPYLHKPWRKQPFEKRLYDHVDIYQCEEDHKALLRRLQTSKPDGCSEDFFENNARFDKDELKRIESSLVEAVRQKNVLRRGVDVMEIDTWGMDCYSRQNIYDAILDAALPDVTISTIQWWFETVLSPAINRQPTQGWNLNVTLNALTADYAPTSLTAKMAVAVRERLSLVGKDYFRVHPKGTGVVCMRESGIAAFTLVEEYLGVLHAPWRWFEIQDILKRQSPDEVPDFYNIILERPQTDPAGFEVTFVDAAAKGTFASRMSHSCDPNCQVAVLSVDGRLTIAMYTTKEIKKGQELTFDYASVTESEKEYRSAICLCASKICRGSFLHYAGSGAFMHVMSRIHNLLHRNAVLLRAAREPLTQDDRIRLDIHGLREACLGTEGVDRVPSWLEKWASLILEYIDMEHRLLPDALSMLSNESGAQMTHAEAKEHAKGVKDNRLQNVVITIDKIRMCLRQDCQPKGPPLIPLTAKEALQYLWTGDRSIVRRFFRAFLKATLPGEVKKYRKDTMTKSEIGRLALRVQHRNSVVAQICVELCQDVPDLEAARAAVLNIESILRSADNSAGGFHTAAADILHLYAKTQTFFSPGPHYRGFTSKPLKMHLSCVSGAHLTRTASNGGASENSVDNDGEKSATEKEPSIFKKYGAHFIWGQLVMWYKQTVNDPTASLSAERRGSLSLPDIESCYNRNYGSYTSKDRKLLLEQLEHRPDSMWKVGTIFTFKNESKIYGSPMLDTVLSHHPMTEILKHLSQY